MSDDAVLLRRYAEEKSEEAFSLLVQRHLSLVYHAALRQCGGDAHRAQDVAQLVFADLARKAAIVANRPVLASWLYTSTRYAAWQLRRTERRRERREQAAQLLNEPTQTHAPSVDWEQLGPVIDEALHALGERDREAVLLRFFEERAFADVGRRLALSEDAARMRVGRALEKIRIQLARRGITSSATALGLALSTQAGAAVPAGLAATVTSSAFTGTGIGGVLGGAFTFMSTTKVISGIAGAVALVAALSYWQQASVQAARAEVAAISAERDALRAQIARASPTRGVASAANGSTGAIGAGATRLVPPATVNDAARPMAWQPTSPVDYVFEHPEARPVFVEHEVQSAKARFERFFQTASVSSKEQEKILGYLAEMTEAKLDLTASLREQGYGPNNVPKDPDASLQHFKLDAQVESAFSASLKSLLGPERTAEFDAYRRNLSAANLADQLAGRLYNSTSPLSEAQAAELSRAVRENRFQGAEAPSPRNTINGTFVAGSFYQAYLGQANLVNGTLAIPGLATAEIVTDAAFSRAQSLLSPLQLTALRQIQAEQAARLRLSPSPSKVPDAAATVTSPQGK